VRLRRILAGASMAAVAGLASAAGFAAPALASSPSPWQRFHEQSFTQPAGDVCPFALRGDVVKDHELFRTLQTYPDGSPREQEFVGPLVVRFTNLSSGASVERNLTGTAYFFFEPDGTIEGHGLGHLAIGVHAVNTSPPAGEYFLTGSFNFVVRPDGTRDFTVQGGTVENLCETLAGP
jgi:hypothetical protein